MCYYSTTIVPFAFSMQQAIVKCVAAQFSSAALINEFCSSLLQHDLISFSLIISAATE